MSEEARTERRILVAVDEGQESTYALSWALKNILFQDSKDTLILLYVKPPRALHATFDATATDDPQTPGDVSSSEINRAIERYSQEVADCVLEKATKLCKHLQHVKVETSVESGEPREVICEMSEKLAADVLVMGSHSYKHGVYNMNFLGGVSTYCSQNVKCPVLIVKKRNNLAALKIN